jgi:hypothetical protein
MGPRWFSSRAPNTVLKNLKAAQIFVDLAQNFENIAFPLVRRVGWKSRR